MTLTGGKRKVNKSLKAWVTFVKKVQKEEKLSYKDAIHRAKVRKDKGEKWMTGGNWSSTGGIGDAHRMARGGAAEPDQNQMEIEDEVIMTTPQGDEEEDVIMGPAETPYGRGGRRRRRTMRRSRSRGRGRGRTARRSRGRSARRY